MPQDEKGMLLRTALPLFVKLRVSSIAVIKLDSLKTSSHLNGYLSMLSGHKEVLFCEAAGCFTICMDE